MVQAKAYHGAIKVSGKDLNSHAETLSKRVLNGVFGKLRLLCVASTEEAMIGKDNVRIKRNFLPFVVSDGKLLSNLLEELQSQRCNWDRIEKHTCLCDEFGNERIPTVQLSSRKRGRDSS